MYVVSAFLVSAVRKAMASLASRYLIMALIQVASTPSRHHLPMFFTNVRPSRSTSARTMLPSSVDT